MVILEESNGQIVKAVFCDILFDRFEGIDPVELSEMRDRGCEPLDYGFAWKISFSGMVQKLVTTKINSTRHYDGIAKTIKFPWKLTGIAFDIPDIDSQYTFDVEKDLLFVSDLHLGSRDIEDMKVLDSLEKLIEDKKPEFLVVVGDFIDLWAIALGKDVNSPSVLNAVSAYKSSIERICKRVEGVFYIPGNHDDKIGLTGSKIRKLIQFEWGIRNLAICEHFCLLGSLAIPTFSEDSNGYAVFLHGHEFSEINSSPDGWGKKIAIAYQNILTTRYRNAAIYLRKKLGGFSKYLDPEHMKLKEIGEKYPSVTFVAGHTHRPFISIQHCFASFENVSKSIPPNEDWMRGYFNIGSYAYNRSYLNVRGFSWELGIEKPL